MLTVHCDQNNSYEITINCFQVRKINEIRNVIFGLRYGKTSSALRPRLECSSSWVLDEIKFFDENYFITITLMTMNSQHSYKNFKAFFPVGQNRIPNGTGQKLCISKSSESSLFSYGKPCLNIFSTIYDIKFSKLAQECKYEFKTH